MTLRDHFFQYHHRLKNENTNMKNLWQEYTQNEPSGLNYSQFVEHYHMWRTENGLSKVNFNKWQIKIFPRKMKKYLENGDYRIKEANGSALLLY